MGIASNDSNQNNKILMDYQLEIEQIKDNICDFIESMERCTLSYTRELNIHIKTIQFEIYYDIEKKSFSVYLRSDNSLLVTECI